MKPWLAFIGLFITLAIINLDLTMVSIALPSIGKTLNSSLVELQWINNLYLLGFIISVIPVGKVSDSIGSKKVYSIGLLIFLLGSLLCSISHHFYTIAIGRFIQGIGFSGLFPNLIILAPSIFPKDRHASTIGLLAISVGVNQALGPVVGGAILEYYSWRIIFLINVPICCITFLLALLLTNTPSKIKANINYASTLFLGIICILLLFTITTVSYNPILGIIYLILTIVLTSLFIYLENKKSNPLIPINLFKNKNWLNIVIVKALFQTTFGIFLFLIPLYIQNILLISPLINGLLVFIYAGIIAITAPITGAYLNHHQLIKPIRIQIMTSIVGYFLLAISGLFSNIPLMIFSFILVGIYTGITVSSGNYLITKSLSQEQKGIGSSLYAGISFYGYALGVAVASFIIHTISLISLSTKNSSLIYYSSGVYPLNKISSMHTQEIAKSTFEISFFTIFCLCTLFSVISAFFASKQKKGEGSSTVAIDQ